MNWFRDATIVYIIGNLLARFCFRVFGRLNISGMEGVPKFGPLIVVSNHLSSNDPPLLVAAIPRPLHFIGKKELFSNPITRLAMRSFHVSSFDRSAAGIDAVRVLMQNLERDRAVAIFPEGSRSADGTMQRGMLGVIYLAIKSQAVILPVGLTGTEKFPLWRIALPFQKMNAKIGPPFTLPVIEGRPSKEVMSSLLDMVMVRIADQLPPEYRGFYGQQTNHEPTEQAI